MTKRPQFVSFYVTKSNRTKVNKATIFQAKNHKRCSTQNSPIRKFRRKNEKKANLFEITKI